MLKHKKWQIGLAKERVYDMNAYELARHVEQQVRNIFCCDISCNDYVKIAIDRTEFALWHTMGKYEAKKKEENISFSVFHSVQYCVFLYYLANSMYEKDGQGQNAEKIYYLNKVLNAVDIFYGVELPSIWGAEHPVGSVMGRAKYDDYFYFYQGCTVGGNKGNYPEIGQHVVMYSNSKIIGASKIGNNVIISANTYIKDEVIPDNSIVFGCSPNLIVKRKTAKEIRHIIESGGIWPAD